MTPGSRPPTSGRFGLDFVTAARRSRFNPIRSLTPEVLSRQLDQFQTGWLAEFALTADAIRRRDDMVSVSLSKREKAISRRSWNILLVEGLDDAEKVEAAKHQAALQFFFDQLTATHALEQNQKGGAGLLFRQMMTAVGLRYAVHEIVWQPTVDPRTREDRLTATFTFVPLWFFENTTGRLRFIDSAFGGTQGQPMAEDEWLVTVGEGIMEPLAVAYIYKRLSLQDWVAFNEKFGMPGVHGKTSAAKDSDAWTTLVEAVQSFSQDFSCVTNDDAAITLIEAKGGAGNLPFSPLVERMDRAIAAICRGADLSTISAGSGAGQGASLQGDEALLLEEDDAQLITEALDAVSRTVIKQLFGTDTPLAYLQLIVPRPKTTDDTIKKLDFLVKHRVPVSTDYARQELDVPAPAEDTADEDLLQAPVPPPQPVAFGGPAPALSPRLANASDDVRAFRAAALKLLASAHELDLAPLRTRLEAALGLDDTRFQSALETILRDFPEIARSVLRGNAAARAHEQAQGSALIAGAATAAEQRQ